MSSTTNLLSHVITTSTLQEPADHVRRYEDQVGGHPEVNVVDNEATIAPESSSPPQTNADASAGSQISRELISVVKEYLRQAKLNPISLHELEKTQNELMAAAGAGSKSKFVKSSHTSRRRKAAGSKERRRQNKYMRAMREMAAHMVVDQNAASPGRKKASSNPVDVSEFTGLRDRDRVPGHEYPCICDLSLTRKSLSEEERTRMGTEYMKSLSSPSPRRAPPPPPKNVNVAKLRVQTSSDTVSQPTSEVAPESATTTTTTTPVSRPEIASRRQPSPPDSPDTSGRPPIRNPPRLKLTVPQSPKLTSNMNTRKVASGKGFDKRVHMNRAAFLRFEHTKYCGRGLTLSLMGGARLREEELALLKKKREKSHKKVKKGGVKNAKREMERLKEEAEQKRLLELKKEEELRMSKLNTMMQGRTCDYYACWKMDEDQKKHHKKKHATVHVANTLRTPPPRLPHKQKK